jgi:multidrug transporter EmrE-like cation transporter
MVLIGVVVFQEKISLANILGFFVVGAGIAMVMS